MILVEVASVTPFVGRTVLVTGNVEGYSRDQAKEAIARLGGTPAAGVTGKVDLVVLGEGAGLSKTAKARSLKIPVMSGDAFAALASDPAGWDGLRLGVSFEVWDATMDPNPEPPAPRSDPAHWVTKAAHYEQLPDGTIQRQVRLMCACGHLWMRHTLWGDDRCPRPEVPVTVAPWKTALP